MAPTKPILAYLLPSLLGLATAQTPCEDTPEVHPRLQTYKCTTADGCTSLDSAVVLDSLTHPVYPRDDPSASCGEWGGGADPSVCPDEETCAQNCVMEGIEDYSAYGVATEEASLTLYMLDEGGQALSPRVYLLTEDEETYDVIKLTGMEFTFDVDVSKLPCGMNGALYMSEMAGDGGQSELNPGGAYYGTGYCDAQCYATPFINGVGNIDGSGSCCNELDIWEANARATHLAPHPCNVEGLYMCADDECGPSGVCDKNGCSYNPYRVGNPDYYGLDTPTTKTVDTTRPFTVVTQFHADEADAAVLTEMHRLYIQDGTVIENAATNVSSLPDVNFLNDEYCAATGGTEQYFNLGATAGMGEAMSRGMVLAMSIWWDEEGFMQWLDGGEAGPCNATEGDPEVIRQIQPDAAVTFSMIKSGEIGSTFDQSVMWK